MLEQDRELPSDVLLSVSVDTEEDDWNRRRKAVTLENIDELPKVAELFARLGVRPTWFTAYHVAIDPRAAAVMREVGEASRAEIAAHLHPWNTPPLTEAFEPRNSMLKNLPSSLQLEKVRRVTAALDVAFGLAPAAFRAGRYGLGRGTVEALLSCGYRVDSSVTPFFSWKETDDGPSFVGAPTEPYWLAPDRDVIHPAPNGRLMELPLSCGFSRAPFTPWNRLHGIFDAPALRPLHLVQLAGRSGLVRRIMLSPEVATVSDMLTLSRRLLETGARHLQLTCHSPSFKPGLSPFAATRSDVGRLYDSIEAYVEGLARITRVTFATVSEVAAALVPSAPIALDAQGATC